MALTREEAEKKLQDEQAASGVKEEFRQPISEQMIQEEIGAREPQIFGGGEIAPALPTTPTPEDTLAGIQERRAIESLRSQRETAERALGAEQQQITPAFQRQRTAAEVEAQRGARNFNEFLASRGLAGVSRTGEGGAVQRGDIARNVLLQGRLGELGTAEAQAQADIARRRTEAEQAFGAGVFDVGLQRQQTELQQQLQTQQLQAEATQRATELQSDREFEIKMANIDAGIREAQSVNDFEREQELTNLKNQTALEQIRLRAALTPTAPKVTPPTPTESVIFLQQDVADLMAGGRAIDAKTLLEQNKLPLIVEFGEEQGTLIYNELLDRIEAQRQQELRSGIQGALTGGSSLFPEL